MLNHASCSELGSESWAEREFGGAPQVDRRLGRRLKQVAAHFARQPSASIPKACGPWSQTKAAYRLFANRKMTPADFLRPHQEQTRLRMAAHRVVLVVQDTTGLNFSGDAELGLLGTGPEGARGLWLHTSMAFSPEGQALGIVQAESWQRKPGEFGKAARRHQRATWEKESQRWINSFEHCKALAGTLPQTQLVSVADREGDLYDWFKEAAAHPEVGVVVRARHNRRTEQGPLLDEVLKRTEPAGEVEIQVPRRPGQRARTARLEVRYGAVDLPAPSRRQGPVIRLWVVEGRERRRGRETPLHWRLVTNLPVHDGASALEKLGWYRVRWQIEEFHRVLKSGCRAEARQLESEERLLKVLMVDLVVAWRVLELSRQARGPRSEPAQTRFSRPELEVLRHWCRVQLKRDVEHFTLREAVRAVAQMGGFLARRRDGEPGAMTLWRGLEMLAQMVIGWNLAKQCG
jgi:hypothetical protein